MQAYDNGYIPKQLGGLPDENLHTSQRVAAVPTVSSNTGQSVQFELPVPKANLPCRQAGRVGRGEGEGGGREGGRRGREGGREGERVFSCYDYTIMITEMATPTYYI